MPEEKPIEETLREKIELLSFQISDMENVIMGLQYKLHRSESELERFKKAHSVNQTMIKTVFGVIAEKDEGIHNECLETTSELSQELYTLMR